MSSHTTTLEAQVVQAQASLVEKEAIATECETQVQSMTEEMSLLQTSKDQLLLEAEGWNERWGHYYVSRSSFGGQKKLDHSSTWGSW